jgi:hypothetical protein
MWACMLACTCVCQEPCANFATESATQDFIHCVASFLVVANHETKLVDGPPRVTNFYTQSEVLQWDGASAQVGTDG